jgi:hypothetical protein
MAHRDEGYCASVQKATLLSEKEEPAMTKNRHRLHYTASGLALGISLGLLLWVLTGTVAYVGLGLVLGLAIGFLEDGLIRKAK